MEQTFCPLTKEDCREDCCWFHTFIIVDPSGADKQTYCSMAVVANKFYDIAMWGERDD